MNDARFRAMSGALTEALATCSSGDELTERMFGLFPDMTTDEVEELFTTMNGLLDVQLRLATRAAPANDNRGGRTGR